MDKEITAFGVCSNRYVTDDSLVLALYTTKLYGEPMTLGQLISHVSIRMATASEARAIATMNRLVGNTKFSTLLSKVVEKLAEEPDGTNPLTWSSNVRTLLANSFDWASYTCRSPEFQANPTLENFFIYECRLTVKASDLPHDYTDKDGARNLNTVKARLDAYALIRPVMDEVTRSSQILQINVESEIGNRDVQLTTGTNIIKKMTASLLNAAQAMRS